MYCCIYRETLGSIRASIDAEHNPDPITGKHTVDGRGELFREKLYFYYKYFWNGLIIN